jgi:hypothetical protein
MGLGRHQVAELPPTAVFYIGHRTHRLCCPGCRKRTRAILGTVGESAFGPGLQAAVVALTARNRISRRDMSELLGEFFGVAISVGAIDEICQRTSLLLAKKKFVVLSTGPGAAIDAAVQKTALLRRQPAIHSRALVQGAIATPEKAWVDLLRETRRSAAPFDYGELGRLLRAMSEQTLNLRALRSYAARLGYQDWLAATIGQRPPNGPAQSRLAAGYAA